MSTPAPAPGEVSRTPRERVPGRRTGASRVADVPVEVSGDHVVPVRPSLSAAVPTDRPARRVAGAGTTASDADAPEANGFRPGVAP